ncbi:MAG: hypothetical protein HOQ20_01930 [Bradyrhizobium sp.]|nr:hypothetical protein [Bradyrhizobium sp.]
MNWELILFLGATIGLPAAFLLFVSRIARLIFFAIGLLFGFGIQYVMELGGPDSPALIIPFFGFAFAAGAMIAEIVILLRNRFSEPPKQRLTIKSRWRGYTVRESEF